MFPVERAFKFHVKPGNIIGLDLRTNVPTQVDFMSFMHTFHMIIHRFANLCRNHLVVESFYRIEAS